MKNEEIAIYDIPVSELLPQRPPFVMIDRLVHFDEEETVTEFAVAMDCIMVDDGAISASGLMENMAQTCAARLGYINYVNHRSIKIGYIGAIRNLCIFRNPIVGEKLTTSIKVKEEVFKMSLAEARVCCGDETIATAEMKIALSDIDIKD